MRKYSVHIAWREAGHFAWTFAAGLVPFALVQIAALGFLLYKELHLDPERCAGVRWLWQVEDFVYDSNGVVRNNEYRWSPSAWMFLREKGYLDLAVGCAGLATGMITGDLLF